MNGRDVKIVMDKMRKRDKVVEEREEESLKCDEIIWKNDVLGGETEHKGMKSMKMGGWVGVAICLSRK